MNQTDIFAFGEGDRWFERNRKALEGRRTDRVIEMALGLHRREPIMSVCELGCANGWHLAALAEAIPSLARTAGSDLSTEAIGDGRRRWPKLELAVGSLDTPGITGDFDLIIVSFVFHWVARDRLAASVSAVDALVRKGGALIVADFLPDEPCARRYHHREDVEIWTYKQDYTRCFTDLGTYREEKREIFDHSGAAGHTIDPQDRAVCALLRKSAS